MFSLNVLFRAFDPINENYSFDLVNNHADHATFTKDDTNYRTTLAGEHHTYETRKSFRNLWQYGIRQVQARARCASAGVEEFTLVQSQVIFRHGARTPVRVVPNVEEAIYDKRIFGAVLSHADYDYEVLDRDGGIADPVEDTPFHKQYAKEGQLRGGMICGQLTTVGMHQCYELGLSLRRRYMHKYKLVKEEYSENEIYCQSTYIKRTLESLQGVMAGLYGVTELSKHKPKFYINYSTEEMLYPNMFNCSCLKEIGQHAHAAMPEGSNNAFLMKEVKAAINFDSKALRRLSSFLVRQDLVCRVTHGLSLPSELEPFYEELRVQAPLDMVQEMTGKPEDRAAGLKLGLGRFHHMLITNMDVATRGNHKYKLSLYSSHDSMLIPLLVAMGCFDRKWPGYASNIAYELWKHNKTGKFFAKVLYNGEEQRLPGKDVLIPYQEFKDLLAPFTVSPSEYKYLCEHTRASIEAPAVEYSLRFDDSKLEGGATNEVDSPLPPGM